MLETILNAIKLTRILKTSRAYKRWTSQRHSSKMKQEGKRLDRMLKNPETSFRDAKELAQSKNIGTVQELSDSQRFLRRAVR